MELIVAGYTLREFDSCNVRLKYDSAASVFNFKCYFNPDDHKHQIIFRPGGYHRCKIKHQGVLLLTGTVLSPAFEDSAEKEWTNISGYSTPGILDDSCILNTTEEIIVNEENQTASIPEAPMEFSPATLENIATTVTAKYGIVVRIDPELKSDPNFSIPFEKLSNVKPEQTVTNYLDDLCRKKNVVLSHNADGELVLTRAKANKILTTNATYVNVSQVPRTTGIEGAPSFVAGSTTTKAENRAILHTFDGGGDALKMKLTFNGQMMHRVVQVVKQVSSSASNQTAEADGSYVNPYVPRNSNGLRFKRVVQQQGGGSELQPTARMIVGDELKNIILTVEVQGLTLGGNLITPNQIIAVRNPDVYLYNDGDNISKWFIQEVELSVKNSEEKATMTCVPIECFTNDKIVNMFVHTKSNRKKKKKK